MSVDYAARQAEFVRWISTAFVSQIRYSKVSFVMGFYFGGGLIMHKTGPSSLCESNFRQYTRHYSAVHIVYSAAFFTD